MPRYSLRTLLIVAGTLALAVSILVKEWTRPQMAYELTVKRSKMPANDAALKEWIRLELGDSTT